MKEILLQFFEQYPQLAIIISLGASILVAVLGLIPSVFITAANILFFGFWNGMLISFAGESLGAAVAFFLYRKGFQKRASKKLGRYRGLKKLLEAEDRDAFWLVISLRLIPFVPSGLVTFAAAIGRISALYFIIASSIGKLPALVMEAYSVREITRFSIEGKIILALAAIMILVYGIRKVWKRK